MMGKSTPPHLPREHLQRVKGISYYFWSTKISKYHFLLWSGRIAYRCKGQKRSCTRNNSTNPAAASWVVLLQAYNYEVEYGPFKKRDNADSLPRLPCKNPPLKEEVEITFFSALEELPIDAKDISRETRGDPVLASVKLHANWMAKLCVQ